MSSIVISGNTYEGVKVVQLPTQNGVAYYQFLYESIERDGNLPSGYTRLTTLKSSVGSYFQTDVKLTPNDVIQITFKYNAFGNQATTGTLFTDNSANGYGLKFYGTAGKSINGYCGGTNFTGTVSTAPTKLTTILAYSDNAIKYSDGTTLFSPVNNGGKSSGSYLKIGEGNTTGSINGEIGVIKVIRANETIRAYYPCKDSSGNVGFYELATNTFYQSAGTAFSEVTV